MSPDKSIIPSPDKQHIRVVSGIAECSDRRPPPVHLSSSSDPIYLVQPGIYVLSGVVSVNVERGQLHIRAGSFDNRSEILLTKADARMRRLVILGHSGTITFQAFRWLCDVRAGVAQIDHDGSVTFASIPSGLDHPRLRRAQALAMDNSSGLEITRWLIAGKVQGQAGVCLTMGSGGDAALQIERLLGRVQRAPTVARLRELEAQAAVIYWRSWETVPVAFARSDVAKVPRQWMTFGSRASPLTGSPRRAGNPANSLLNYLYSLLRASARIAALIMGLDPAVGIQHADMQNRDGLACDLMEPARPIVDAWLLALLRERRWARGDFCESPDGRGEVRLTQHLANELCSTLPLWSQAVGPIVEHVAQQLISRKSRAGRFKIVPTKLTESRRSSSRKQPTRKVAAAVRPRRSCLQCGKSARPDGKFCSRECTILYRREVLLPEFTKAGASALQALRAAGKDPAHGDNAARKRGQANTKRAKDRAAWKLHGLSFESERARFVSEIQPRLSSLTVKQIERACGLSPRYALLVRDGRYIPHPVHYPALAMLLPAPQPPAPAS